MMCFLSFSFQCYITCKAYLQQAPDSPQSGQQSSHKCESQPGHSRTLAHDQSAAQQAQASLWHQPSNQGESLWYLWGICDSAGLPEGKTPTKVFIMSFQWSLDAMKLVEQSPLNIFTFAWTFSCNWGFFVQVSDQQSRYFKVICGGTFDNYVSATVSTSWYCSFSSFLHVSFHDILPQNQDLSSSGLIYRLQDTYT